MVKLVLLISVFFNGLIYDHHPFNINEIDPLISSDSSIVYLSQYHLILKNNQNEQELTNDDFLMEDIEIKVTNTNITLIGDIFLFDSIFEIIGKKTVKEPRWDFTMDVYRCRNLYGGIAFVAVDYKNSKSIVIQTEFIKKIYLLK